MATARITKRTVDALKPTTRDEYLWDRDLAGFGVKVTPADRKVYLVQYRRGGGSHVTRRVTLGTHGPLTAEQARIEARRVLSRVRLGGDPAEERASRRRAGTISELADRYLKEHVAAHNKASTQAEATRIVNTRIKPKLGRYAVGELSRSSVKQWHQAMSATPYEANRALAYLSKMMSLAATEWELRPDNPCKGIGRFPERKRERFFSDDELQRIGKALSAATRQGKAIPSCIDAIRLLALTGCRVGEILALRWRDVDLKAKVLRLPDAKAGARTVPLGAPALAVLDGLKRDSDFVVHGPDTVKPLSQNTLRHFWDELRIAAKIPDGRPHDFRHTTGTYAAQAGANAFMVRDLLGHKTLAMTGRYVERAADPVRSTADMVSKRIASALWSRRSGGKIVKLDRRLG
jgi:integrase